MTSPSESRRLEMKDSDDLNVLVEFLEKNEYDRASVLLRMLSKNPLLDRAVFEAVHPLKEGAAPSTWSRIDWMLTVTYWRRWYAFLDVKEPDRRKPAYDRLYVNEACETIPHSFDYAVNAMGYSLEEYVGMFLSFKYIKQIEIGNPRYVCGLSGRELANRVTGHDDVGFLPYQPGLEYWIGWILAYYQWSRNTTYRAILKSFPLDMLKKAYPMYHEMARDRMMEFMDETIGKRGI